MISIVNNGLDLKDYITQVFPLDKAQDALACLAEKKEHVIKVLVKAVISVILWLKIIGKNINKFFI